MRRALENTTASIGDAAEEKLTTGQGLMQIDRSVNLFLAIFPVSCWLSFKHIAEKCLFIVLKTFKAYGLTECVAGHMNMLRCLRICHLFPIRLQLIMQGNQVSQSLISSVRFTVHVN